MPSKKCRCTFIIVPANRARSHRCRNPGWRRSKTLCFIHDPSSKTPSEKSRRVQDRLCSWQLQRRFEIGLDEIRKMQDQLDAMRVQAVAAEGKRSGSTSAAEAIQQANEIAQLQERIAKLTNEVVARTTEGSQLEEIGPTK